jgi:diacylglycerol kinase
VASAAAVGLGLLLRFNLVELALLVLSLTVVLAAEIVNTSIEMLCDELRPEPDQAIGRVKDVAAAATAMSEIGLAIVGVLLIARHLLPWLAP